MCALGCMSKPVLWLLALKDLLSRPAKGLNYGFKETIITLKIFQTLLFQLCPLLLVMTLICPPCSVEVNSCLPKQTFGLPKDKRARPGSRIWHALQEGLFYIYNMYFSPLNPHVRPEDHV